MRQDCTKVAIKNTVIRILRSHANVSGLHFQEYSIPVHTPRDKKQKMVYKKQKRAAGG